MAAIDLSYQTSPKYAGRDFFTPPPAEVRYISSSPSLNLCKIITQCGLKVATQPSIATPQYVVFLNDEIFDIDSKFTAKNKSHKIDIDSQPTALIERLNQIKDRFAWSVTQMAELFGVTRKSVYDWYEGAEPRGATASRIEILFEVMNSTNAEVDLKRLKSIWNINVSERSFRAIFMDDKLDTSTLRTELTEKLHELSSRMVTNNNSTHKTKFSLYGEAHLAEFDRKADFS